MTRTRRLPTLPLILLTLAGVVVGLISWLVLVPPTHVVDSVGWDGAIVDPDGLALVVSFTGGDPRPTKDEPCWEGYEPQVVDRGDHVELTLQRVKAFSARAALRPAICNDVGYVRSLRVALDRPLAGRPVHDAGRNGGLRPVIESTRVVEVPVLPDGAQLGRHSMRMTDAGETVEQLFALRGEAVLDPRVLRLGVIQTAGQQPPPDGEATSHAITIHGRSASLFAEASGTITIEWPENGWWIRVVVYRGALPSDELVRIAEGTRVP